MNHPPPPVLLGITTMQQSLISRGAAISNSGNDYGHTPCLGGILNSGQRETIMETELLIEGIGFPPLSARGCVQHLQLIEQGHLQRTVNGELCYVGPAANKYRSIIRCEDRHSLVTEGVLVRGHRIRVGCLQRLWQQCCGAEITLDRPAVAQSIAVVDRDQQIVPFTVVDECTVHCAQASAEQPLYLSYRPWLWMRVVTLTLQTHEWELKSGWQLVSDEI